MSGKGSGRRPQQVPDTEAEANWQRIFGKTQEPAESSEADNEQESE